MENSHHCKCRFPITFQEDSSEQSDALDLARPGDARHEEPIDAEFSVREERNDDDHLTEESDTDEDQDFDPYDDYDEEEEVDEENFLDDFEEDLEEDEIDENQQHQLFEAMAYAIGGSGRLGSISRLLCKFPLVSEYSPSGVQGDLAGEMQTHLVGSCKRGNQYSEVATRRDMRGIQSCCPPQGLLLRECIGRASYGQTPAVVSGMSSQIPIRPFRLLDRMQSRGYIFRFSGDGDIGVAAFQSERKIKIYNAREDFKVIKDVHARNLRWTVTDLAISGDQKFLLYSSITPTLHLVNIERGGALESVANVTDIHQAITLSDPNGAHEAQGIWSLRWSQDSSEIIAGTGDDSLWIYDVGAERTTCRVHGHRDDVNAVAYAEPDESSCPIVFTGSDDHNVKVWDTRMLDSGSGSRAKPVGVFVGHTQGVTHIDPKGDGRYLISNGKDQMIKLWDLRSGMRSQSDAIEAHSKTRNFPTFYYDYRWMPYPASDRVLNHPADSSIGTYRGHSVLHTLCRAYFSPVHTTAQRYIYAASADGAVYVYDVLTCKLVHRLEDYHFQCVRDCCWHPYDPVLVTVGFDGCLVEWRTSPQGEQAMEMEEATALALEEGEDEDLAIKKRMNAWRLEPEDNGDQLADYW